MNKNKTTIKSFIRTRPLTTVEKIRSYRNELYESYIQAHKKLDIHGFYEEMIKGKKCGHT
ncbi:MAG: hypothetical protein ABII94_01000 [Patescibacteria group bacterium]|nr:hypothetical protein [Patescibacteria group bacterium]MBU1778462.1 hypothetical protein [Patescibacteria group bacterium]MBU1987540.1 hypothetical protein [Patescibacteria group bacterium]